MSEGVVKTGWAGTPGGVTVMGLVGNIALGLAKVLAGVYANSQAIFADGLHTGSDAITDLAVLAGLRISGRPADADHRYGHSRAMAIVAAVLAVLLMATGAYVGWRAIVTINDSHAGAPVRTPLPIALAVLTIVFKEWLYRVTRRVARKAGDMSLLANAWHHRSDAFSSIGVAAALTGVALGWQWLDHVTALLLASFLVVIAAQIIRDALAELMDRAPSPEVLAKIERSVADTPGVVSFHAFRARRLGGKVEMDIHVQVDPGLSVRQGHDIARLVRQNVQQADPNVLSVIVHVEPKEP